MASENDFPSPPLSPETDEFVNLERRLAMAEEDEEAMGDDGDRSELPDKLEERRQSQEDSSSLQLTERRQLRQFSRADEYLYAMKEDLSEWLNLLYPHVEIDADNFLDRLETGEHLVKHANAVRQKAEELLARISRGETKQRPPDFALPERDLPCRTAAQPGTWFARDNVYNFIRFCRVIGVMECVMFETEDLVCRKNEKHVILTLLEVARRGAKIGILAPTLVQFEQEIDREIARDERDRRRREERQQRSAALRQQLLQEQMDDNEKMLMCSSMLVHVSEDAADLSQVEDDDDDADGDDEEEEEEEEEGYAFPIGPLPQTVNNDLKSLDEMVRELVSECQCPTQFPMIRVSEGKYRIGDTKVLIFVRILRNHVMVRVGGGWDTLQHYLDKHDPCRCRAGHRSTVGAHLSVRGKNSLTGAAVCYDRADSPGTLTPRRRSSATNLASGESNLSGQSSAGPQRRGQTPQRLKDQLETPVIAGASSCDSSSEVSDEGYKSSQGSKKLAVAAEEDEMKVAQKVDEEEDFSGGNISPDRPESSLTAASECSSTISSSDDNEDSTVARTMTHQQPPTTSYSPAPPQPPACKKSSSSSSSASSFRRETSDCSFRRQPSDGSGGFWRRSNVATLHRSRSVSSENNDASTFLRSGGSGERSSFRSNNSASSRYLQAAEAYVAKRRAANNDDDSDTSKRRGRETFQPARFHPPARPRRTASASPAPHHRRNQRTPSSDSTVRRRADVPTTLSPPPAPSTKSTPRKKPSRPREGEEEDEDEILKRMEEILLTYKSRVEDRLAAEGRQLPEDIFEDFTTSWVKGLGTGRRQQSPAVRTTPNWRRDASSSATQTRIPAPTFFQQSGAHV